MKVLLFLAFVCLAYGQTYTYNYFIQGYGSVQSKACFDAGNYVCEFGNATFGCITIYDYQNGGAGCVSPILGVHTCDKCFNDSIPVCHQFNETSHSTIYQNATTKTLICTDSSETCSTFINNTIANVTVPDIMSNQCPAPTDCCVGGDIAFWNSGEYSPWPGNLANGRFCPNSFPNTYYTDVLASTIANIYTLLSKQLILYQLNGLMVRQDYFTNDHWCVSQSSSDLVEWNTYLNATDFITSHCVTRITAAINSTGYSFLNSMQTINNKFLCL